MASFNREPKTAVSQTKAPEPLAFHVASIEKEAAYDKAIRSKMATEGLTWPEAKEIVDAGAPPAPAMTKEVIEVEAVKIVKPKVQ